MVGAYVGWLCVTYLGMPLPPTLLVVVVGCGLLGVLIERLALRPLHSSPRIAPLLSTIGVGLVLDQVAQLLFTPDPRGIATSRRKNDAPVRCGRIGRAAKIATSNDLRIASGSIDFERQL